MGVRKASQRRGSWGGGRDSQIGEGVEGLRKTFHTEGGVILGVGNGMATSTELVISSLLVQGLLPLNVVGGAVGLCSAQWGATAMAHGEHEQLQGLGQAPHSL